MAALLTDCRIEPQSWVLVQHFRSMQWAEAVSQGDSRQHPAEHQRAQLHRRQRCRLTAKMQKWYRNHAQLLRREVDLARTGRPSPSLGCCFRL